MILVDVNLLIYSVNQDAPNNHQAKSWLEAARAPRVSPADYRTGLFQTPLSVDAAFDVVDAWLEQPSVTVPEPTARHLQTIRDLISPLGTGGNLTSDAHLAALAIEHGAELCLTDNDFGRFSRLRWRNPLA